MVFLDFIYCEQQHTRDETDWNFIVQHRLICIYKVYVLSLPVCANLADHEYQAFWLFVNVML